MKRLVKGQGGIELMVVYAAVILCIGVAFIAITNMGGFKPGQVCTRDARGFSSLAPVDWGIRLSSNDVLVSVRNDAGMTVELTGGLASLERGVNCTWTTPGGVFIAPDELTTMTLTCNPALSTKFVEEYCYVAETTINYTNADNGRAGKSIGTLRGVVE